MSHTIQREGKRVYVRPITPAALKQKMIDRMDPLTRKGWEKHAEQARRFEQYRRGEIRERGPQHPMQRAADKAEKILRSAKNTERTWVRLRSKEFPFEAIAPPKKPGGKPRIRYWRLEHQGQKWVEQCMNSGQRRSLLRLDAQAAPAMENSRGA